MQYVNNITQGSFHYSPQANNTIEVNYDYNTFTFYRIDSYLNHQVMTISWSTYIFYDTIYLITKKDTDNRRYITMIFISVTKLMVKR